MKHSHTVTGMTTSEPFTIFADQALSILKFTIERLYSPLYEVSPYAPPGGGPVDLSELLGLLGAYMHRLGRDEVSLRLKAKFCGVAESVMGRKEGGSACDDFVLRSEMMDWMMEWPSESSYRVSRAPFSYRTTALICSKGNGRI